MNGTYKIHQQNYLKVISLIDKLNQRARKLHQPEIQMQQLGDELVQIMGEHDGLKSRVYTLQITGETPGIDGWKFVAALTHEETGNIVKAFAEVPEQYRMARNDCDHCGIDRNRKQTYVLQDDDGNYKQVGSTCLKDFTGYVDIHAVASFCEGWHDLEQTLEEGEEDGFGGGSSFFIDAKIYMAFVLKVCDGKPFISKTKAQENQCPSTSEIALEYMLGAKENASQEQIEKAAEIIAWAQEYFVTKKESRMTDYDWNCSVVIFKENLNHKDLGLFASIFSIYQRETGRKIENECKTSESLSVWLGEIGGKIINISTVVSYINSFEAQWGTTYLYKFVDTTGNILTWFASSWQYLKIGDRVIIEKATVKNHDQYNGEKQTVITRAKIIQLEK